jgi:LPXTG-motif cell wall-anchored protein
VNTAAVTTVAPTTAAPAQLPHTGSSSGPLALFGFGLLVSGLAAIGYARSRRRTA